MERDLLNAYIVLRRINRPVGVREFQRIMGYRSPGKAKYVLDKLVKNGLAYRNEDGKYIAIKELPLELSEYIVLRGVFVPRLLTYAVFATVFTVVFILLNNMSIEYVFPLFIPVIPYYIESIRLFRRLKKISE